jgi:outer membrane murein-binding lipoprotein Lpp
MKQRTPLGGLGLVALLGAAVGMAGCQGAGAFAQVSEKLNQISDTQTQILSKLDALETKLANMPAAGPAAAGKQPPGQQGPQPGKPDPAATYKVAVAATDSSKGPADAKVTLVEWSDFQ